MQTTQQSINYDARPATLPFDALHGPAGGALTQTPTRKEADDTLRAKLTPGESVLWQGAPSWQAVALKVFHLRIVALYFAVYAIAQFVAVVAQGGSIGQSVFSSIVVAGIGMLAIAILSAIAVLVERTTLYTITSKRLLLGIGVALPKTFNIPFSAIEAVNVKQDADGTGTVTLKLVPKAKIAALFLWPHMRPWRLKHPEPALRCVAEAAGVASLLGAALQSASTGEEGAASIPAAAEPQPKAQAKPRPAPRPKRPSGLPSPIHLAIFITLVSASLVVVHQFVAEPRDTGERMPPAAVHNLTFTHQSNGEVSVTDADSGDSITTLQVNNDGLIRGALRGFSKVRAASQLPADAPYQLIRWQDGSITLSDGLTGDRVPIDAFGPMDDGATKDLIGLAKTSAQ